MKPALAETKRLSRLRYVWLVVRTVFVVSILGVIASNLDWYELWKKLSDIRPLLVLLGFSLILLLQFIVVFRWYVLLRNLGAAVPLLPLLAFHLVGIFYSQFLPTSIGGDVIKGYYLSRKRIDRIKVISSALVDRLIGLVSNGVLGLFALTQVPEVLDRLGIASGLVTLILLGILGGILVGYGALFFIQQWTSHLPHLLRSINDVLLRQAQQPMIVMLAVLISMIHFLGWAFSIWLLALAVQITNISYFTVLLLLAAVNIAQLVPLSINGWGIREGTLVALLGLYDVSAESAILLSLLIALSALMLAVVGGCIVLSDYRYQKQAVTETGSRTELPNSS